MTWFSLLELIKIASNITSIINNFSILSGLYVNHLKSKVISSKTIERSLAQDISNILGIKSASSFGIYLGFPFNGNKLNKEDFQIIISELQSKLAGWKTKYLTMTGRITLINHLYLP